MTYDPQAAITYALKQVGRPYQFAAAGPLAFDCSGLTMRAAERGGLELPHNALQQAIALNASPVRAGIFGRRLLKPGDIVFYYKPISHCAIVVWSSPGGWSHQVVAATNPQRGVELLSLFEYARPVSFGYIEHS